MSKRYTHPTHHAVMPSLTFTFLVTVLVPLLLVAAIAAVVWSIAAAGAAGAYTGAQSAADAGTGIVGPIVIVGLLVATIKKVTDFPSYVKAQDWDSVSKQSLAWAAGIAGAFILRSTPWAETLELGNVVLAGANAATTIVFGFAAASGAGIVDDVLAAVDRSRSSSVPPLVGPPAPGPVQP